jgi:hypothetical protein
VLRLPLRIERGRSSPHPRSEPTPASALPGPSPRLSGRAGVRCSRDWRRTGALGAAAAPGRVREGLFAGATPLGPCPSTAACTAQQFRVSCPLYLGGSQFELALAARRFGSERRRPASGLHSSHRLSVLEQLVRFHHHTGVSEYGPCLRRGLHSRHPRRATRGWHAW